MKARALGRRFLCCGAAALFCASLLEGAVTRIGKGILYQLFGRKSFHNPRITMASIETKHSTNKKELHKQTSSFGRSVVDFVTAEELKQALATVTPQGHARMDWKLPMQDPDCEDQTPEGELQRLLNLKSFMLLDAEKEEEFDKLTQEAREVFGVPTSLISLIDLGRQFFISKTGAEASETTRAASFCGYTIMKKDGILVVPDAKQDDRFKDGELVNSGAKTRFYAGAALISPEGEKLGAFCLNGSEPRPEGLTDAEQTQLKKYAAKTMDLMVQRRKGLRDILSADSVSKELRKHAAVATSLGDIMYTQGDLDTAMRLYQESVQTIMFVEENGQGAKPPPERQQIMLQLLTLFATAAGSTTDIDKISKIPEKSKSDLMKRVKSLYEAGDNPKLDNHVVDGIAGLFYLRPKVKGASKLRLLPGLVFSEVFKIDMREVLNQTNDGRTIEELDFTVPIEECAKATLFNMGQIQYHWQNQETAMQFFHLAASVSHKMTPLYFDPIDISCINNMAQIHLQYGQPDDALKMLKETLERGNRTLAAMYRLTETEHGDENYEVPIQWEERDCLKTRRLRKKLALTILNIAHVQFYKSDYEGSIKSLENALPLLDKKMTGRKLAAVWFNMSLIFHRVGKLPQSVEFLDKFIGRASSLIGAGHLQIGDAFHEKAVVLYEMKEMEKSMECIEKAIDIRCKHLGDDSSCSAESLELKGKLLMDQQKYEDALVCLTKSLDIEQTQSAEITLEVAQTLMDLGRAYNAVGKSKEALSTYQKVLLWAKDFFGPEHAFCDRISGIIGGIQ